MIYVVTQKNSPQLDMPVFDLGGRDCIALFSSEAVARFFAQAEPNSDELAIAQILASDLLKLIKALSRQGIEEVAIDPRPAQNDDYALRTVALSKLESLNAAEIIDLIRGIESGGTNASNSPSVPECTVVCNQCGREEVLQPNETLPYCCDRVMLPAALDASSFLLSN